MALIYAKFSKKPQIFLKLFGIDPEKAWKIIEAVKVLWDQEIVGKYKRPGRNSKLGLGEMVLLVLLYYRSYSTYLYIGLWFGVDLSQVCRIIQRLEPLLARVMVIPKDRTLDPEDVKRLIDATEQPILRPKKDQNLYYSGKKKRHTLKTEIRTILKGRIVQVSQSKPGSVHDFEIYKTGEPFPKGTKI